MKRVLPKITAAILMATAVTACSGQKDTSNVSGSVEVLAPMNNAKSGYSLQFIELSGLDSLREVSGRFVRFFISPRIISDRLNGSAPQGRFIKNTDNKYIPANDMTQQMVTIYAHMQNLAQLDEDLGAAGVNHWPRDIGVGVRVAGGMKNNAFYDGKIDAMLFVPYDKADLPIAVNGGILAHEHFHSLFYKLVIKSAASGSTLSDVGTGSIHDRQSFLNAMGVVDSSLDADGEMRTRVEIGDVPTARPAALSERRVKNYYATAFMRGLNEGLADFWGWMYTGDPDFIATSLPSEKVNRTLKYSAETNGALALIPMGQLRSAASLYNQYAKADFDKYMLGMAYNIGTRYARVMKKLTEVSAEARSVDALAMRKEVAKWIIKSLPTFKDDFAKSSADGFYAPSQYIENLAKAIPDMNKAECEYLVGVINNTDSSKRACSEDGNTFKMVEAE
ncbi:MAG: hypothetical protein J7501_13105 [Bdellovibrio sp.]|nr:hypothetical protein [Bdellovibrio sp.]